MGEARRIAVAFVPAVVIHVLGLLALGGLVAFGLERTRVLPVALLDEPPPLEVTRPAEADPAPTPAPGVRRKPGRTTSGTAGPAAVPVTAPAGWTVSQVEAPGPPAPPPAVPEASEAPPEPAAPSIDALLAEIRARIAEHLVYPPLAKKNRMEGTVKVLFEVASDGSAADIAVTQSSGFEILDDAAVRTVVASAPYPLVPVKVKIPVVFTLE